MISKMYVIEHMEQQLYKWCIIEYTHISEIVGRENVMFTNVKDVEKFKGVGDVRSERVSELNLKNACVLDPFAEKALSADEKFDYYVFGGILGDEPMQKRTAELDIPAERRHLGRKQMSTDTAVYVAKHIIDGGKLSDLEFKDEIEIPIQEGESMILPYRYVMIDGQPMLPKNFVEFLKQKRF